MRTIFPQGSNARAESNFRAGSFDAIGSAHLLSNSSIQKLFLWIQRNSTKELYDKNPKMHEIYVRKTKFILHKESVPVEITEFHELLLQLM